MPVEIEAKMSVESFDPVRARLRAIGARQAGENLEINTFFDTEDRSLLAADEGLRLRVERGRGGGTERYIITWKGPRQMGVVKNREEHELEVDGAEPAVRLLEKLGYLRTLSFEKRRETWEFDGCRIELDELPHLGRFVEVEGPDERTVLAVREHLGLSHRPIMKGSYIALLSSYLQDRGITRKAVTFADRPLRGD